MSDNSKIEWTDASWNPIRAIDLKTGKVGWHCEHATTGCEFCYAEGINKRLGTGLPFKPGHRERLNIALDEKTLLAPLRWKKPRMIFVCSMTDAFADFVADEMLDKMFAVMALCPQHTFQVLTKRGERMRDYFSFPGIGRLRETRIDMAKAEIIGAPFGAFEPKADEMPLPNVWLGVSCERQQEADERIPLLLQTPAAVRFISAEPLLGPIDLHPWLLGWGGGEVAHCENCGHGHGFTRCPNTGGIAKTARRNGAECTEFRRRLGWGGLDWVIVGGESGPKARPMHPDWARSLRDQCQAAGVAFFLKQWGEFAPKKTWNVSRQHAVWTWDGECRMIRSGWPPGGTLELPPLFVERVGKKAAGRLLDGVEHNGMPT